MSLNERFTQLRRPEYETQGVLGGRVDIRGGTAKNKRLALQMSRRPTVVAALAREAFEEIKTSAQRNGYGAGGYNAFGGDFSPRGGVRRSYRGRGRGRGIGGGGLRRSGSFGNLSTISPSGNFAQNGNFRRARSRSREPRRGFGRSASVGRMQRSSSVTSLRSVSSFKGGRGRGRGRGSSRGRGGNLNAGGGRLYRSASTTSLNSSFRGRGRGRGRGNRGANSVTTGFINRRDQNRRGRGGFNRGRGGQGVARGGRGGYRGRGAGRGRGRGGRGGRWQKEPMPDKDALDKELDVYMSGSRAHLDKELDNYMSEKWE